MSHHRLCCCSSCIQQCGNFVWPTAGKTFSRFFVRGTADRFNTNDSFDATDYASGTISADFVAKSSQGFAQIERSMSANLISVPSTGSHFRLQNPSGLAPSPNCDFNADLQWRHIDPGWFTITDGARSVQGYILYDEPGTFDVNVPSQGIAITEAHHRLQWFLSAARVMDVYTDFPSPGDTILDAPGIELFNIYIYWVPHTSQWIVHDVQEESLGDDGPGVASGSWNLTIDPTNQYMEISGSAHYNPSFGSSGGTERSATFNNIRFDFDEYFPQLCRGTNLSNSWVSS